MKNIKSNLLNCNYNIIDIRDSLEYKKGHIYNAININMNVLIEMPEKFLDKSKTYYIYCNSGFKSKRCVMMLDMLSYDVINVVDGYEGFKICQNSNLVL